MRLLRHLQLWLPEHRPRTVVADFIPENICQYYSATGDSNVLTGLTRG
jgi:hypothetical protein